MNKDKAIQLLERLQDPEPYEPMLTKDAYDAIQMAIDALSADGDTISREAAVEVIDSFNVFESRCDQIKLEQMIGELPTAQPEQLGTNLAEVGTDCISRQAAIDALKKRQDDGKGDISRFYNTIIQHDIEAIEQLPPAQLAKVATDINVGDKDTISRKAAIDGKICIRRSNGVEIYDDYVVPVEYLEQLPPAQPEIIRCKDCKHWIPYDWMFSEVWRSKNMADYPEDEIGCNYCDMTMKANDFCSRAERREVTT